MNWPNASLKGGSVQSDDRNADRVSRYLLGFLCLAAGPCVSSATASAAKAARIAPMAARNTPPLKTKAADGKRSITQNQNQYRN
jgi:hypothetical protein